MSEPNYAEILGRKYPGNTYNCEPLKYRSIVWSARNAIPLPSKDELDALWPEVETEIATEREGGEKDATFQGKSSYPLQEQIIITARAVQTGDLKVLNDMLAAWDAL